MVPFLLVLSVIVPSVIASAIIPLMILSPIASLFIATKAVIQAISFSLYTSIFSFISPSGLTYTINLSLWAPIWDLRRVLRLAHKNNPFGLNNRGYLLYELSSNFPKAHLTLSSNSLSPSLFLENWSLPSLLS